MSSAFSIAVDLNIAVLGQDALSNLTSKLANIQTALQNINTIGLRGFTGSLTAASEKVAALSMQMDGLTKTRTANVVVRQTASGTGQAIGEGGSGGVTPIIASGRMDARGFRFNELSNITMAGFAIGELTHGLGELAERAGHVQSEIARLRLQGFTESEIRAQRSNALRISGEVYGASESDAMQTHRKLGGIFGDEHVTDQMTQYALALQKAGQTMGTPESAEEFFKHFAQTVETGKITTPGGQFDPAKALTEMQRTGQRYLAAGGDLSMATIQHTARMAQTWIKGSGLSDQDAGALQNAASLRFGEQGGDWLNTFMRDTSGAGLQNNSKLMSVMYQQHPELFDTSRRQIIGANPLHLGGGELQEIQGGIMKMPEGMNAMEKGQLIYDSITKMADQIHQRTDNRNATEGEKQALVGEVMGPEAAQIFMNFLSTSFKATLDKQKESIAKISTDPKEISRLGRTPAMAMAEFSAKLDNVIGNLVDFSHSLEFLDSLSRGMQRTSEFFNKHPDVAQAATTVGEIGITAIGAALLAKITGSVGRLVGIRGVPSAATGALGAAEGAAVGGVAASGISAGAVEAGAVGFGLLGRRILAVLGPIGKMILLFEVLRYGIGALSGGSASSKENVNAPRSAMDTAIGAVSWGLGLKMAFSTIGGTLETLGATALLETTGLAALGTAIGGLAIPVSLVAAATIGVTKLFEVLDGYIQSWLGKYSGKEREKQEEEIKKSQGDIPTLWPWQNSEKVMRDRFLKEHPHGLDTPTDLGSSDLMPLDARNRMPEASPTSTAPIIQQRRTAPQTQQTPTSWFNMGNGQVVTNAPTGQSPIASQPSSRSSIGTQQAVFPNQPAAGNSPELFGPPSPFDNTGPSIAPNSMLQRVPQAMTPPVEGSTSGLARQIGVPSSEIDTFRNSVAQIEHANYDQMGGSGNRYAGKYQMGATEIAESAKHIGMPVPSREEFLQNPALQEKLFERYTQDHDSYLNAKNPKYAAMSPEQKLAVLGYAHNQGAGGASKWLDTGVVGRDAYGTAGTAYSSLITQNLRNSEAQKAMQSATSTMPAGQVAETLSGPSVSKTNYENQPTNTHTNPIMMNLHLDGEIVARNTFDRIFDMSPAGLSGLTGFDTRQNPLPPGVSIRG